MYKRLRAGLLAATLSVFLFGCKKNDVPKASASNNDIVETVPQTQTGFTLFINPYIGGYMESLPQHYSVTTKNYPLLIFLPGGGQVGDGWKDLPLLLNDGVAKLIDKKTFPPNFSVGGSNYSFIVLTPQLRAFPPDSMVQSFIDYAVKLYRVDRTRIYVAGLSMGGVLSSEMAGHYSTEIAAALSISGESFNESDRDTNARNIAKNGLALWAIHNSNDPAFPASAAQSFINLINQYNPVVKPKITIFQADGHDAWSKSLDPMYKENNKNVYEWMLQYHR